jgi:hypothetical protein
MIRRMVVSFLLALALGSAASDAGACWNITRAEFDQQARITMAAQRALDAEDPRRAIALVQQVPNWRFWLVLPDEDSQSLKWSPPGSPDRALRRRMQRIYALAVSRSPTPSKDEIGVASRAMWTARQLADFDYAHEPSFRVDQAEWDAFMGYDDEAFFTLMHLAERDLIGSPHAYALLARLHSERGNTDAAEAALARCNKMANPAKRASICVVP